MKERAYFLGDRDLERDRDLLEEEASLCDVEERDDEPRSDADDAEVDAADDDAVRPASRRASRRGSSELLRVACDAENETKQQRHFDLSM